MKILVIAPTPFFADRGTHIRILEEARALERRGHFLTIATYHIGKDAPAGIKGEIRISRIAPLMFWYRKLEAGPSWQKVFLDIQLFFRSLRLVFFWKPDVIHAHLHEGILVGWAIRKIFFWRKIRLLADFHGSLVDEMFSHGYLRNRWLKKLLEKAEAFIGNLGDAAITSSWENSQAMSAKRKKGGIETVTDGVDADYYVDLDSRDQCRVKFGLDREKTIVAYTGSLIPNKGLDYLLDAIDILAKSQVNLHFVLAGYPAEEAEKFVRKKKLEKSVTIISPLDYFDLPYLLKASDIGIDPKDSSTQQASGKILQYMAAGLPVVCFDRINNRNYLGGGGVYAGKISADSLAKAVSDLASDPEAMEIKGRANRSRAENFSWRNGAEKIEQIVKKC